MTPLRWPSLPGLNEAGYRAAAIFPGLIGVGPWEAGARSLVVVALDLHSGEKPGGAHRAVGARVHTRRASHPRNRVSPAMAFPNGVWERGAGSLDFSPKSPCAPVAQASHCPLAHRKHAAGAVAVRLGGVDHSRQVRVSESERQRERPAGQDRSPRRRAARLAQARLHHLGMYQRQHRHRPLDGRRGDGLSRGDSDVRRRERGAAEDDSEEFTAKNLVSRPPHQRRSGTGPRSQTGSAPRREPPLLFHNAASRPLSDGMAPVIVLALLVLISVLVIAFLSSVTTERSWIFRL
jgi:hypothetical protein